MVGIFKSSKKDANKYEQWTISDFDISSKACAAYVNWHCYYCVWAVAPKLNKILEKSNGTGDGI